MCDTDIGDESSFTRQVLMSVLQWEFPLISVIAAALLLTLSFRDATAQEYLLTDLGTLGGATSYATGINANGVVCGSSLTSDTRLHAFSYSNGVMQDLGALAEPQSVAAAINDEGQIAGSSSYVTGNVSWLHAVLFSQGSIMDLGALDGTTSEASGISDSGAITGYTAVASNSASHAFLYTNGLMEDLGTLGGALSEGMSVNNKGEIAGWSETGAIDPATGQEVVHAFIYRNGVMKDLGSLGAADSYPFGINELGEVTGSAAVAVLNNEYVYHAFLYRGDHMIDLGTLPGDAYSGANAINTNGEIVGSSVQTDSSAGRAIIYKRGKMYDLNTLDTTSALAHFVNLFVATAINDNGYIVANGIDSRTGTHRAYLLTPKTRRNTGEVARNAD